MKTVINSETKPTQKNIVQKETGFFFFFPSPTRVSHSKTLTRHAYFSLLCAFELIYFHRGTTNAATCWWKYQKTTNCLPHWFFWNNLVDVLKIDGLQYDARSNSVGSSTCFDSPRSTIWFTDTLHDEHNTVSFYSSFVFYEHDVGVVSQIWAHFSLWFYRKIGENVCYSHDTIESMSKNCFVKGWVYYGS